LEDRAVPAAALSITPITWNAIGLDSNNVNVGPNQYMVGARVTNTGDTAATNVAADFVWDSANAFVNLLDQNQLTSASLAAGASQDFYFNVALTRNAAARETTRRFHISAQADGVPAVSTPNAANDYRELYVENLISQNRNAVTAFNGPTTVQLGQTVTYTLNASTSTAYPQLAVFASFDNRIFQIQSVAVTYSTPTGATNTTFYANASLWQANPAAAGYNDVTATENPAFPGGKAGGTVSTTIVARVIGTGTTSLVPTITDFSGSSFHYNADAVARALAITATSPAADLSLTKTVSNATPNVGDTVSFTVTLRNQGPNDATGVQVTDLLPSGLTFQSATPAQGTYSAATGLWNVGMLANGASTTLTVVARVDSSANLTNTAQLTASDPNDPDATDNQASATVTAREADLNLTKSVSNAAPNVGDTVTFTLTLTNTSAGQATEVRVNDLLPAGLVFVSANTPQGTYNATTGVWNVGTLSGGAAATLTLQAQVSATSAVTNTATVTSDVFDPDPNDNTGTATVTPQRADLSLTKGVDNATPNVGDTVTFTITLNNQGPNAATNISVQDVLPVGLAFVSSNATAGSYTAGTGLWAVGTLANGATATLTIQATVTTPNAVTNFARISQADQFDPDPADNDFSAGLAPQRSDLSITKTVSDSTPNVGDTVTFTVTLNNQGPNAATGIQVTDQLPAGLAFASANTATGTFDSATGVWSVGTLASGASATLTINAVVTRPDAVSNVASVTAADQYDEDPADNAGTALLTPQRADLSITKTVNDPSPVVGDTVTFTITLNNEGPDEATGVQLTDLLPSGLSFVSANPSTGTYDSNSGIWTVGTLADGGLASLTIVATLTSAGSLTNVGQVSASDQFDPDLSDNTGSANLTGQPGVGESNLGLSKSVSNASPNLGDTIQFTVTLTNNGPDDATGVEVSEFLPAGLSFVNAIASVGTYDEAAGIWTVGALANTLTATLTIEAVVTSPDAMTNVARVRFLDQLDPADGNNTATADVTPQRADLALTKTVDNAAPNVGDVVTFTLTLSNTGPNSATGVAVTDQLPAGFTFVNASTAVGGYNPNTGIWTVGALANNASATLTIQARVDSPAALTNFASVSDADQYDPVDADNLASAGVTPARADLSVTKAVDKASPNFGDVVTFTLSVTNTGPDAATNVTVSDPLTSGLQYVSDSSAGSYNPATGVWTVGNIPNGATATLSITARVLTTQPVTNVVQVVSLDQYDPDPSDDRATIGLSPTQSDLSVTKTVDVANPISGQVVTFTIVLNNTGANDATGVQVTDQLPVGLTYQSATMSQGGYDPVTGVWNVGDVANGSTATLAIRARVDDPGALTNLARVTASDQFDPDPADNQSSATVTGQVSDLVVTVTPSTTNPNVGDSVTFTVTLSNQGPNDATNITVLDQLPAGMTYVTSSTSGGSYDPNTGAWTIPGLAVGETVTLTLTGTITGPGSYSDTAQVTDLDQFDTNLANNSNSAAVTTSSANLSLTKVVDNAAPNVGETVRFTVTVANNGPSAATNIEVTDQLPAGLTFVNATTSQGVYDETTGVWTVGDVADGGSATLTIFAQVTAPASVTNLATVTSAVFDPDTNNNGSSATVTPKQSDLSLSKTVDNAAPNVGDTVTFTLTLTNSGPDTATGVQVTDQLPAGLTFISANPSAGTYDSVTGIWNVGDVLSGTPATITIVATVSNPAAVTNLASITRSDVFDPDNTDNSDSVGVTPQQADLVVDVATSDANPLVGETLTLTVTLTNSGPYTATGVQVMGLLPSGLQFVSANAVQGSYDSATGIWQIGTVPATQSVTLAIQATVTRAGTFTDSASVSDADQFDPNSANNSDSANLTADVPTAGPASPLTLAENSPGGTASGTLTVSGLDPSNSVTWTLLDNAGGRFVISGNEVDASASADLNFEASTTFPIRVRATDEFGNTYDADLTVNLTDVNEAPVNSVPGLQLVARNGSLAFSAANGNAISVADVDRPGSSIRITLSIPAGTGTLTVPGSPAAVTLTGNGTATVTVEGTPAAIAQALNGLAYRPPLGFVGTVPLTVSTDDLAHNFFSGNLTDVDVVTIQVANTPPQPTRPTLGYVVNMASRRTPTKLASSVGRFFTDANADPLSFHLVGSAPRGLRLLSNGKFSYKPPVGFVGTVRFKVRAFDGLAFSNAITITVKVAYGKIPCGR
jgi:uncharacterized repeat protein (TIGR01451 family)